jgi:RNA polymerase sigma factor (sigma-70 family)
MKPLGIKIGVSKPEWFAESKDRSTLFGFRVDGYRSFAKYPINDFLLSIITMQEPLNLPDDETLVRSTQEGDTKAFDILWQKYSSRVYSLIYNMTSNHEDTNDLLLEVFAKAYRSINGFRGKSSFYTWIHVIAVNMTINFVKKRGRRFHMSLDDLDANIQNDKEFIEMTAPDTPVRAADLSELQQRLNEAMMKLSVEHRAVVTMFDIQGMPHAEIAKILGIPEATVRSRLFYAHRQLQNYLEEFRKP